MTVAISDLLAPADLDRLIHAWESRSMQLRARCDPTELFGLSIDNCFEILGRAQLDRVVVAAHQPSGGDEYAEVRAAHAQAMHRAGLTVCWKVVNLPQFVELSHDLEQRLRLPGWSCNVYLSPDKDGFSIHYDRHSTLIIQLSGAKEWWYSASPTVPDPLKHFSEYRPPARDELKYVTLEPGDILYMPPSCWHTARAKDYSLALTFAPRESVGIVKQILDAAWQPAPMPALAPGDFGEGGVPDRARKHIEMELARLRTMLDELSVDSVWAHWFLNFARPSSGHIPRAPRELQATDELSLPAEYPVSIAVSRKNGSELHAIHCHDTAVAIDMNAQFVLQTISESRRLTGEELVKQLGPEVKWAEVSPLVAELVSLGFVEVNSARHDSG